MYEVLSVSGNGGFSSTSPMLFIVTVMDKAMVMAIMMITFTSSMVVCVCVRERERVVVGLRRWSYSLCFVSWKRESFGSKWGVEDFGVYKLYSRNKRRVDADKVVKGERSSLGCASVPHEEYTRIIG